MITKLQRDQKVLLRWSRWAPAEISIGGQGRSFFFQIGKQKKVIFNLNKILYMFPKIQGECIILTLFPSAYDDQ